MSLEAYAALPDGLWVRELRHTVAGRGRRRQEAALLTTLLDPERCPKTALAELYGLRWRSETDLRSLKQTLEMDVLRCKSVEGVTR